MKPEERLDLIQAIKTAVITEIRDEYYLVRKKFDITDDAKLNIIDNATFFVCQKLFIQPTEIKLRCRIREVAEARQIVFFVLRKATLGALSFREMGSSFGLDHATVLYSINKIEGLAEVDKTFKHKVYTILAEFQEINKEELRKFKI